MAEYRKILDRSRWLTEREVPLAYPLAQLGLARAAATAGDFAQSRQAYEEFFQLWKDADPDLPILIAAKQEYARLKS